jgi:hypothetical protein
MEAAEAGQKSGQPCRALGQEIQHVILDLPLSGPCVVLHANLEDYCAAPHTTCRRHQVLCFPGSLDILDLQAILRYHQRLVSVQGSGKLACHLSSWQERDACCQVAYFHSFSAQAAAGQPNPSQVPEQKSSTELAVPPVARNRYNPADRICRNLSHRLVPKVDRGHAALA